MNPEFGQHFLIDEEVLLDEIRIANLKKTDVVLEIGAGKGILTEKLAEKAGTVLSFEIDASLRRYLKGIEERNSNLKITYDNALKYSWGNINKIVANISYNISEQVILKAIESKVSQLVLIVGENFKKLLESRKTKIGIISNLYFSLELIRKIPKNCFSPKPRVNSWLIKLKEKKENSKKDKILKSILTRTGKVKNAIIYSLIKNGKTKNQAREIVNNLKIEKSILEKPTQSITGKFLILLEERLKDFV